MYNKIIEGKTTLLEYKPPANASRSTYIPRALPVFFNTVMHYSRDLGIVFAEKTMQDLGRKISVADVLAGSGARGLRYAKEVKSRVLLNDLNPKAVDLIKKSIALNNLKNCEVSSNDANKALLDHKEKKFDLIDLDPFGPPTKYLDNAFKSILRKGGLMSVTATDLAALKGRHPKACMRKYFSKPIYTDFPNELAVRIMISNALMHASENEVCFDTAYSYTHIHSSRVFLRTFSTPKKSSQELAKIGYFSYCSGCGNRDYGKINEVKTECDYCGKEMNVGGPVYLGEIRDKNYLREALELLNKESVVLAHKNDIIKALNLSIEELSEPFYYDTHRLSRINKKVPRKTAEIISSLREKGFKASKSAFSKTGFKTNAPFKEAIQVLSNQ